MSSVSKAVRDILSGGSIEYSIRSQILELAGKNLHDQEVVQALVDSLDYINDFETKRDVLRFLFTLQPVRFSDLGAFLEKLLTLLAAEKERDFRLELIKRLIAGLSHDSKIVSALLEAVVQLGINDDEAELLISGISKMPSLPINVLESLLIQNVKSSVVVKERILRLLKNVPEINEKMTQALTAWLTAEVDTESRAAVLKILSQGRKLSSELNFILIELLKNETSTSFRMLCLDTLTKTQPWDSITYAHILTVASVDSSAEVRTVAHNALKDQPELNSEDQQRLATLYFKESSPQVRHILWAQLKLFFREEPFRNFIIHRISETSLNALEESDFNEIIETLYPYFRRNREVKNALMELASTSLQASRRENVVNKILPLIDLDLDLPWLIERFRKEPGIHVKNKFFSKIENLSVTRFQTLVDVYVEELFDPSSTFRLKSVNVLSPAAELYPQKIVPALEEILLYDTQPELVRGALKGYLLPGVVQRFDVLITIIKNDSLEFSFRKQAIGKAQQNPSLTEEQSKMLNDVSSATPDLIL